MQAGNAEHFYDVFTNMKTEKNHVRFLARLRHPPRRVTGSNSLRSRPQQSEPEKKKPSGKETRETLEEMGFSGDGSSRSEC